MEALFIVSSPFNHPGGPWPQLTDEETEVRQVKGLAQGRTAGRRRRLGTLPFPAGCSGPVGRPVLPGRKGCCQRSIPCEGMC